MLLAVWGNCRNIAKLTFSLSESSLETCKVVLTHSNEISLAVLSHGAICFAECAKMKFGFFLKIFTFATTRSVRVKKNTFYLLEILPPHPAGIFYTPGQTRKRR